jgi:hypothetical protein
VDAAGQRRSSRGFLPRPRPPRRTLRIRHHHQSGKRRQRRHRDELWARHLHRLGRQLDLRQSLRRHRSGRCLGRRDSQRRDHRRLRRGRPCPVDRWRDDLDHRHDEPAAGGSMLDRSLPDRVLCALRHRGHRDFRERRRRRYLAAHFHQSQPSGSNSLRCDKSPGRRQLRLVVWRCRQRSCRLHDARARRRRRCPAMPHEYLDRGERRRTRRYGRCGLRSRRGEQRLPHTPVERRRRLLQHASPQVPAATRPPGSSRPGRRVAFGCSA